jgi:hypothetical protein
MASRFDRDLSDGFRHILENTHNIETSCHCRASSILVTGKIRNRRMSLNTAHANNGVLIYAGEW